MSKRLRARPNKSRSLRPRSQKARELEVPGQEQELVEGQQAAAVEDEQVPAVIVEERQTFPEPAVTGSDHPARLAEPDVVAPVAREETTTEAVPDIALSSTADAAPAVVLPIKEHARAEVLPAPVVEMKRVEAAPASKKKKSKGSSTSEPPPARSEDKMASAELLESGVSAEFFRNEEDSVPPFVDSAEEMDDMARTRTLTPAAIARRARLRRVVAGVVTFAAVLSLGVLGKVLIGSKAPTAAASPAKQEMVAAVPVEAAKPAEAPKPDAPKPEAAKVDEPKKDDKAEADKSADAKAEADKPADPKAAEAKAEGDKPADADKPAEAKAPDAVSAAELKKKAESLLNRGDRKGAIPLAQAAIEADPSDAYPYLLLGSALQDSGKWKDGVEQYCECVRHATRGPINECRAMGGHK